ncbi:hypothetical protein FQN50_002185 [Emmonsiellopsis sp. PD_5]|nr:hypothetical protein FQN50_002185 [Emmonsiellopsis sp. PD_5]
MAKETILRIRRSDSPDDVILVKATRSSTSDLDLKLVATEGEAPYRGSVKSAQIDKLRVKNYQGSAEEWENILAYVLGQRPSRSIPEQHRSGLEVAAVVKPDEDDEDEKEIVITLRKRIDTITQRLGTIVLKQDDDQAIQLFDWTNTAVTKSEELDDELASLTAKYDAVESTINKLNSQLDDLIKAKTEHDDQLIAKFAQLLNEKKLKIRNQQRLLATAKVDPAKVDQLDTTMSEPGERRRRKRKAEEPAASESEDGFDTMAIDKPGNEPATNKGEQEGEDDEDISTESERQETPEPLEDETATEDEAEAGTKVPAAKSTPPPATNTRQRTTRASSKQPTASPPPRRELPFAKKWGGSKPAPVEEGDSDDDDEL